MFSFLIELFRRSLDMHYGPEPPPRKDWCQFGEDVLHIARQEIGNGEVGANNRGKHVRKYLGGKEGQAWCAAFVSYCIEQGAAYCGVQQPVKRAHGAKKLFHRIGKAGSFVERPRPGDVVCWHRGRVGSWQGHIGIVESYDAATDTMTTIEGNRGPYPSVVARYSYHVAAEQQLIGFARFPEVEIDALCLVTDVGGTASVDATTA